MFPESSLREEAFYKQGEVLFANGAWAAARTAFDEYRRKFPKGRLVDAALFWGGGAAEQAGEGKAAALLWEQLIAGSSESPFRGEGLRKTAEVYAQSREYAKSLQLYTRFIAEYPEEARAARADIRAEQVRYQSEGFGDREAELSAVIARETGAKKREATIELARLYIYSGEKRAETGYRSLLAVIAEGEPESSARALFLLGEYLYRKGDLQGAARQFLSAAVTMKNDPSFTASALFRATEMMHLAKRPDEVDALVKRLEDGFPGSEWTAKAKNLREADQ
jgi:TolA-binding protein